MVHLVRRFLLGIDLRVSGARLVLRHGATVNALGGVCGPFQPMLFRSAIV
jgi:hypothetical protein